MTIIKNKAPSLYRGMTLGDVGCSWVHGDLLDFDITNDNLFLNDAIGRLWISENANFDVVEVNPETVGMWTGLTDINDRDIYEDDIVRIGTGKYIVTWNQECAGFQLYRDDTWYGAINEYYSDIEVIGNIHGKTKHAKWEPIICGESDNSEYNAYLCPVCGEISYEKTDYCPECGFCME